MAGIQKGNTDAPEGLLGFLVNRRADELDRNNAPPCKNDVESWPEMDDCRNVVLFRNARPEIGDSLHRFLVREGNFFSGYQVKRSAVYVQSALASVC